MTGAPAVFSASFRACAIVFELVEDENLLQQAVFFSVGLEAAFGDLLEHLLRLALVLIEQDRLLARQDIGRGARDVERDGIAGGDVHRDLAAEREQRRLVALAFQADDHADLAEAVRDLGMHVVGDDAFLPATVAVRRTFMFSPIVAIVS